MLKRMPAAVLFLLTLPMISRAQAVSAVPHLDDAKLAGTWYEIARYPSKHERQCTGDAFELVARGDKLNQLQLVDSCKTKKAYTSVRNITANPQDKLAKSSGDGRLKITTVWPFHVKYWVLALGANYEWSLIGSPDHKNLWIFSRSATLAPDVLAEIEAKATAEGFVASRLTPTAQGVVSEFANISVK